MVLDNAFVVDGKYEYRYVDPCMMKDMLILSADIVAVDCPLVKREVVIAAGEGDVTSGIVVVRETDLIIADPFAGISVVVLSPGSGVEPGVRNFLKFSFFAGTTFSCQI